MNGTAAADVFGVTGGGGSVVVQSAALTLTIVNAESANDSLTVSTGNGTDAVNASGLANTSLALTVNGGNDDDVIVGSQGNDTLNGDAGNDVLFGGIGNDTLNGGADTDFIDGGAGTDTATNGETVVNVP